MTFKNLIELDAKWLPAYSECGHAYYLLRRNEEALNYYLKAIRIGNLTD